MLKKRGKQRVLYWFDGNEQKAEWSAHPTSAEEALEEGLIFFKHRPPVYCAEHNDWWSLRYAKTGISRCCSLNNAGIEYEKAFLRGEPTDPTMARSMGKDYYWKTTEGRFCGHPGKTTLSGDCYICREERLNTPPSPRQAAIAAGEKWYMPHDDDPCKKCGQVALRRVTDGACRGCLGEPKPIGRQPDHTRIDRVCPDMTIDRETAREFGYTVFRTGDACKKGHKGWRYVSTGGCIDCLKGIRGGEE